MLQPFKVVIPARYASSRLPAKPLLEIGGQPMIRHVIARAAESGASEIIVATDDERIAEVCADTAATALLTGTWHRSGSERLAEVIERLGWAPETLVVNLQGDEPGMPAVLLAEVAANLARVGDAAPMATLAVPISEVGTLFDPHVVKVVTDAAGFALYFSRAPLPWHRDEFLGERSTLPLETPFLRHVGLYAYRAGFLARYVGWEPAPLERAESLEQLRVLWHGERIHVGLASVEPGHGIDTPEDLARARAEGV